MYLFKFAKSFLLTFIRHTFQEFKYHAMLLNSGKTHSKVETYKPFAGFQLIYITEFDKG